MNNLTEKIGYRFKNAMLLEEALTHTSYANEHGEKGCDNERLEFLGDSVLSVAVSRFLFCKEPPLPEGELTKARAALVCEQALYGFALELGLGEEILLGKGEDLSGGRERPSILSDCFEAVIAAIYLDGGYDEAERFVLRFVEEHYNSISSKADFKSRLQEIVQQNRTERLRYCVVSEEGPDHDKLFTVEVMLNSNIIGRGTGHSKKQAEQAAAAEALALMGV